MLRIFDRYMPFADMRGADNEMKFCNRTRTLC